MNRETFNPIDETEVTAVFTDCVVARNATMAGLSPDIDVQRLANNLRATAAKYAVEVRMPTPNTVHREFRALHDAASAHNYEEMAWLWTNLSYQALAIVEDCARRLASGIMAESQPHPWGLPTAEQLRDPDRQEAACEMVQLLLVKGQHAKITRGKPSRTLRATLRGPMPSRSEPRRAAERRFVARLYADFANVSRCMPPRTAHHDVPGPFAHAVAACLRLVRAPAPDVDRDHLGLAVQLINDIDDKRKLNALINNWRRLLGPLLQFNAVSKVGALIEKGMADVQRVNATDAEASGREGPTLFEFTDTEQQLCFCASRELQYTLSVKAWARKRILKLAEDLLKASSNARQRRRRRARRSAPA